MGHGASTRTNVKRVSIHNDIVIASEPTRTPRSSSDGCIVETLNSSKTKAELLEVQLEEYKKLLKLTESKHEESKDKAKLLEEQLAEVEGKNFELIDRVTELEQQLEGFQTDDAALQDENQEEIPCLEEQLHTKDQSIEKLKVQVNTLETDMKKMRSKFKKRLKAAQMEVAEAKQEGALKVYSLKDDIKRLEEENTKLIARLDRTSSASKSRQASAGISKTNSPSDEDENKELDEWEDGRTKLIVELSNQMSAQEEHISDLEKQLSEKDAVLKELQASSGRSSRPSSGQSRKSSAKSGRTHPQKSRWGYPAEVGSTTEGVENDQQWLADEDEDCEKPVKLSSRGGSRKSSAGSQKKLNDKMVDSEGEVSANIRTNQRHSSRNNSAHKNSSRNSSAVSHDSAISQNNGDVQSRTSSSAGSSRQRRRLQAALDESSRHSPHRTDSAFSDSGALPRTKDGKDSGIDIDNHLLDVSSSHQSDLKVGRYEDIDQLMSEAVGFPSFDSNI